VFPRLKSAMKKALLWCDWKIKNAKKELKRLSQNGFQECFQQIYSRWQKCIAAQGDYFEEKVT
jgi:hypothetical protein